MTSASIGSSFDTFYLLKENGSYEEVTAAAVKRVLAWRIEQLRIAKGISKSELARQMKTSRTQIERLLDPANTQVQLDHLQRAAVVLGSRLVVELA